MAVSNYLWWTCDLRRDTTAISRATRTPEKTPRQQRMSHDPMTFLFLSNQLTLQQPWGVIKEMHDTKRIQFNFQSFDSIHVDVYNYDKSFHFPISLVHTRVRAWMHVYVCICVSVVCL